MNRKNKVLVLYRVLMYSSISLVLLALAFIIVILTVPAPFQEHHVLLISICLTVMLTFSVTTGLSFNGVMEQRIFINQLETENTYTLGEAVQFYNLDAFKTKASKYFRRRFYTKQNRYIIAFTPTALDISSNRNRDKILREINLKLVRYFDRLFSEDRNSEFEKRNTVYAFSRGIFFFFFFAEDDTLIHRLITTISNECFRMVNEDKVKIWVQPFFGIKKIDDDSSITSSIEDVMIARDRSEKNYESFTYFKESFRASQETVSTEIADALDNNEFIPYYQPKYSLIDHKFISVEALARWNSPVHGLVGPAKFIEEAERAGLLNAIDIRIFELAVKDVSENLKRGRRVLPVSVNFSLYEFFSRNFLNTIIDTLKKYQVPAQYLQIEITETTSQVNKFLSLSVIKKLKDHGIRVLMDDFGVGYSQIENLRQIPFDAIKIDKSFTDRIVSDEKTRSITKFLVELGHSNNMEVIVEGAETKEEVEILRKLKVDTIQGFYYSRPLSFEKYNELLKANAFEKGAK